MYELLQVRFLSIKPCCWNGHNDSLGSGVDIGSNQKQKDIGSASSYRHGSIQHIYGIQYVFPISYSPNLHDALYRLLDSCQGIRTLLAILCCFHEMETI